MGLQTVSESLMAALVSRQAPDGFVDEDGLYVPFWYTKTGIIVKWSLFLGFLAILFAYLILGYMHAKRRIRRGLLPLAYHRWLVSRSDLARVDPRYGRYYQPDYRAQADYSSAGMVPLPPPVYDANAPRPPKYDANTLHPPMYDGRSPGLAGATKVDAGQWRSEATRRPGEQQGDDEYEAPAGPPPSAMRPQNTGSSNNPYRV